MCCMAYCVLLLKPVGCVYPSVGVMSWMISLGRLQQVEKFCFCRWKRVIRKENFRSSIEQLYLTLTSPHHLPASAAFWAVTAPPFSSLLLDPKLWLGIWHFSVPMPKNMCSALFVLILFQSGQTYYILASYPWAVHHCSPINFVIVLDSWIMFSVTFSLHSFTLVVENQIQSIGDTDLLRWQQMKMYMY